MMEQVRVCIARQKEIPWAERILRQSYTEKLLLSAANPCRSLTLQCLRYMFGLLTLAFRQRLKRNRLPFEA